MNYEQEKLGVLTSTSQEHDASVTQAIALARSINIHNPGLPVAIAAYPRHIRTAERQARSLQNVTVSPVEPMLGLLRRNGIDVSHPRACFMRKLALLEASPFDATIWLDNDMLVFKSLTRIAKYALGERDLAMVVRTVAPSEVESADVNELDPARTRLALSTPQVFQAYGGGHYIYRRTPASGRILAYCLQLMKGELANERGEDLYRWLLNCEHPARQRWAMSASYNPDEPAMVFSLCRHDHPLLHLDDVLSVFGHEFVGCVPRDADDTRIDVLGGTCSWRYLDGEARECAVHHFYGESKLWKDGMLSETYRREVARLGV
jgi:hypothetical protein